MIKASWDTKNSDTYDSITQSIFKKFPLHQQHHKLSGHLANVAAAGNLWWPSTNSLTPDPVFNDTGWIPRIHSINPLYVTCHMLLQSCCI